MATTTNQHFARLLQKEKQGDLIALLQTLDADGKKALLPELKEQHKIYNTFGLLSGSGNSGGGTYGVKGTNTQITMLSITAFVCCSTLKDFTGYYNIQLMKPEALDPLLAWYCPRWFSDFINGFADSNRFGLGGITYSWYMDQVDKGTIKPLPLMQAVLLVNAITTGSYQKWVYQPEILLERPITLQEHIWYLFEMETTIHWADNREDGWTRTFQTFTREGKLPRQRVLAETLRAANRNFNQTLTNWFIDLFIALEPTVAETIELQPELTSLFNSPQNKAVNAALKYLKDLCTDDGFDADSFINHAEMLLASEGKTVVTNTLMMLERLAKKYPERRIQLCNLACQAFIHHDDALQSRAAKLIAKYGDTTLDELKANLEGWQAGLLLEARQLLSAYLILAAPETIALPEEDDTFAQSLSYDEEIPFPQTFDEFVFLASQAFDNNEVYHFDLLPAAVLKFQNQLTRENVEKLLPAFQRAFKTLTDDWNSTRGYLDDMLARFFTDYGRMLNKHNPKAGAPVEELYLAYWDKLKERKDERNLKRLSGGFKAWDVFTRSQAYKPHKHILLNAVWQLERKMDLPLLSTPTHLPCMVHIEELIKRISLYQAARVRPGLMDYQVAIARCFWHDKQKAVTLANSLLTGEPRQLIGFILGEKYSFNETHQLRQAWVVAAHLYGQNEEDKQWLSFSDLTPEYIQANFSWKSFTEHYLRKEYNYKQRQYIEVPDTRKALIVNLDKKHKSVAAASGIKNLWNKLTGGAKKEEYEPGLFDFICLKFDSLSAEQNDMRRMLYLCPQQPELLLAYLIDKVFRYFDFSGENEKRIVIYTLETLMGLPINYGPMAHLLIATCMVSSDKAVRSYAAELWIKGVREQTLHSEELGNIIGRHTQNNLFPLKRLTDLMLANMYNISAQHNRALETLLIACLTVMPTEPANGHKKLLDIYLEVVAANRSSVKDSQLLKNLDTWAQTDSLKTPVKKLLALA